MTTAGIPFRKTQSAATLAASTPPMEVLEQALCAQADPEKWFPEKGGSTLTAKTICGRCPVQQACLDYALATETGDHHRHGIWGGLAPRERAALARLQGQAA